MFCYSKHEKMKQKTRKGELLMSGISLHQNGKTFADLRAGLEDHLFREDEKMLNEFRITQIAI